MHSSFDTKDLRMLVVILIWQMHTLNSIPRLEVMVKKYKQRKDKVLNCIYNFEIGGLSCLP
jgi:hypothetical protein